ncbi:MAG: hypothetical protein ACRDIX_00645 [Actinomycetota bacterium]
MPAWLTSWWTFGAAALAGAFGLWRLFRSMKRWRPSQGADATAVDAELRVRMASHRTLEGGA